MIQDLYPEDVIELYKEPLHQGILEHPDHTVSETNASCGDSITVSVRFVKNKSGTPTHIVELKWQGQGCVISQVAMSLLSEYVLSQQVSLDAIETLEIDELLQIIGFETISPGRLKCVTLGLQALKRVIQQTES